MRTKPGNSQHSEKRLFTAEEVAIYLGISSVKAVYKRVKRNQIPFCRWNNMIRFDRKEIDRWIEKHSIKEINI